MVKAGEKVDQGEEKNGEVPKESQETWFLWTQPSIITKGEPVGPKTIQPPEGKKHHIKPFEMGGGVQWPTKLTTSTPSKNTSSVGEQPPRKSAQGTFNVRGRGARNGKGEEQPLPRPPPKENGGGGGNGNGNGGDDGDDDDEEEEDDEDTDTVNESENGEDPDASGGGRVPGAPGGGDGPPPNPGVGMWDLEVEGGMEVKEDEEGGQVHRVYQVYRDHRYLRV